MSIELGDRAKDKITGFTGIVTAITRWISGCDRINVQPEVLHDGRPIEGQCFDDTQLEVVEKNVLKISEADGAGKKKGGPRPTQTRAKDTA